MLSGSCHCGAVRIEIPRRPRTLTNCNCSICRRYGTLWATGSYSWGRKALRFVRCRKCGCVTHWQRMRSRQPNYMGVNARNFEPAGKYLD